MQRKDVIEFGFKLAVMQNLEMFKEMQALKQAEPDLYAAYLDLRRSVRPAGFHAVEDIGVLEGTPREVLRRALET